MSAGGSWQQIEEALRRLLRTFPPVMLTLPLT
jgi:hypothetical protein